MPKDKDDVSTDVEKKAAAFAKDMTAAMGKLAKAAEGGKAPVFKLTVSRNKVSKSRTPAEQAGLLVKGSTKVCWSSHMADKARHVIVTIDGKWARNVKAIEKALGKEDFAAFKKKWGEVMKKHGLKNAAGKDGWPTWDQYHLELPDSKVPRSDQRAKACLEEYVRLTRKEKKKQNPSFEKRYSKLLKPHLKKHAGK